MKIGSGSVQSSGIRIDGREQRELRPFQIELSPNRYAEGSCLVRMGNTHVLCCASVSEKVPNFLKGTGHGWVSAEYSMLPRSSHSRTPRDSVRGRIKGRSHEIMRLIGRSLRCAVDLESLGERQIIVDCDVLQADGGTRTASVTGGFIALYLAGESLVNAGVLRANPVEKVIAAISVGIVGGRVLLDLNYEEDSAALVDMNLVMTDSGEYIEVQATGEESVFSHQQFLQMLNYGREGIIAIIEQVKEVLP